ncbi:MAG: nucleotidyltransferase family protein [Clostridia bacterium]|nr:nucleotidyltransferase family protein [Clostridia bacterium]
MRVVGIVAEYNPLHNGHIYHMEQAKKAAEADFCIIAMSGNFVQRGEPACADKFTRAEWALRAGADMIVEIPQCLAVASAERYAEGAVKVLASTGVVTDIAFGVETDDLNALYRIADILDREPPAFRANLAYHLKEGKSYPRAQFDALADLDIPRSDIAILTQPNNILAVEYIKAIRRNAPQIRILPIRRVGNGYNDTQLSGELSSATAIREALKSGNDAVLSAMPLFVSGAAKFDSQFPVTLETFGPLILYRLRSMSLDDLSSLPDVAEGFEQVLARAVRTAPDLATFLESVKSKRYTMARCKRIAVSALLHIQAGLAEELLDHRENLYLRVLGFLTQSRGLLAAMASVGSAPVILRNSDIADCTDTARDSLAIDAFGTDLFAYVLGREVHRDAMSAIKL